MAGFTLWAPLQECLSQTSDSTRSIIVVKERPFFMSTDKLKNVYIIDSSYTLFKYASNGKLIQEFADWRQGPMALFDAFNPQKLLVYYPDFNKAVVLDQSLSSVHAFDLEAMSLWNVDLLCLSNDNHLWYFDNNDRRLKKVTASGEVVVQSDPLHIHFNGPFNPYRILERNNSVYLLSKENGVLLFDAFGQFNMHLPIAHNWLEVVKKDKVLFSTDDEICVYGYGQGPAQNIEDIKANVIYLTSETEVRLESEG